MEGKILIAGGYGAVGSIISEQLARHFPGSIIVAGRSWAKAEQLARKLGNTIIPYVLDIGSYPASMPQGVRMVIMCVDQNDTGWVTYCMHNGIHYIDITANSLFQEKIALLDRGQYTASVILSVGLAPGITNLLARHCLNKMPQADSIDIFVLLGLGEQHGAAAYKWIFDNLDTRYTIAHKSGAVSLKSFTAPERTSLEGDRNFYLFNFPDQHALLKTTTARQVHTRMAFESRLLTKSIYLLRQSGLTRIFSHTALQKVGIKLFRKLSWGTDIYGVKVVGRSASGAVAGYSMTGYGEGKATAFMATEIALHMWGHEPQPGLYHSHEIIADIPLFLERLKKYDLRTALQL